MGPRDPAFKENSQLEAGRVSSTSLSSSTSSGEETVTILGFGSLLSEKSSRLTFPELKNFRLGRVPNYRRVFCHPASIFFQRGIADLESLQISSLSAEYAEDSLGFIVSVFEVANDNMIENGVPSLAFLEREEEFEIIEVPYIDLDAGTPATGLLCTRSTDEAYLERWGSGRFERDYVQYGVNTIWGWPKDSGIRPCAVYLRHCYLAAESMGEKCFSSFLDETFLVDRKTTIRNYFEEHPEVLEVQPPQSHAGRYSG